MKELLIKLNACDPAIEWAGDKSWPEIFEKCHRGDWLLWLFKKTNPNDLKEITRAKAHCALTVRHLMKDERSVKACEMALKFADGEEELNASAASASADAYAAADAAYAASAASATAYAAYAAYAAADAAYAAADADASAYVAASAAADAAYAASAAADAYAAADADAAMINNQLMTADICRKYLPIEIWNINL